MNPTPLVPVSQNDIIALLATQKDNHLFLREFVKTKDLRPANIFLPQTMKMIDAEMSSGKEELVLDCINFLDAIKIYSLSVYGDSESYLNSVKAIVVSNRCVPNIGKTLAGESVGDYVFTKAEDAVSFLENNPYLLSIYVYALINFILYSEV